MSPLPPFLSWLLFLSAVPAFAWVMSKLILGVDAARSYRQDRAAVPFEESCVCGHDRTIHEHYRRGTECAGYQCVCRRYEPEILAQVKR